MIQNNNVFHKNKNAYSVALFIASLILAVPGKTSAFVAVVPGAAGVYSTIAVGEVLVLIALFICVPIALGGFLIRLLGFSKTGEKGSWKLNLKGAFWKMLSYLIYHSILFGGLIAIARTIQKSCVEILHGGTYYAAQWCAETNPFNLLLGYSGERLSHSVNSILFPLILGLVWPYAMYKIHQRKNPQVIPPTAGTYVRMIVWNGIVITLVFLLAQRFL